MKICWIYRLLLLVFCRDIVDPVIDFFHLLFEALIVTLQASFFFKEIVEAIFLSKTTR